VKSLFNLFEKGFEKKPFEKGLATEANSFQNKWLSFSQVIVTAVYDLYCTESWKA